MIARIMAADAWRWLAQVRQSCPPALRTLHKPAPAADCDGDKYRTGGSVNVIRYERDREIVSRQFTADLAAGVHHAWLERRFLWSPQCAVT
jgi:hypothetical protein